MLNNNKSTLSNSLFIKHFTNMTEPRRTSKGNYGYPLNEIIFLVISAVISGADSWTSIETFGHSKLNWLQQFLPYKNGIPSDDVLGKLFARLNSKEFIPKYNILVNDNTNLGTKIKIIQAFNLIPEQFPFMLDTGKSLLKTLI